MLRKTAWVALKQTIDVISQKSIWVVINGGALNPEWLAENLESLVRHLISQSDDSQDTVPP